jgi:hypothetical protein
MYRLGGAELPELKLHAAATIECMSGSTVDEALLRDIKDEPLEIESLVSDEMVDNAMRLRIELVVRGDSRIDDATVLSAGEREASEVGKVSST